MILRYHIALRLAHLGMPCTLVFLLGKMSLHSLNEYIHELYCLNAIYIKHKQMSVGQLFIKYIKFNFYNSTINLFTHIFKKFY